MIYTPKKDFRKTTRAFLIGVLILLVLFLLSNKDIIHQSVCQTVFFFEAVYFTYILNKFVLPFYTYTLNSDNFVIVKTVGDKSVIECNLDIERIVCIIPYKEYKKQEKTDIKSVYNYCANITASSCYCLIFEYSNRRECVMFEPDNIMVEALNKVIKCGPTENQ